MSLRLSHFAFLSLLLPTYISAGSLASGTFKSKEGGIQAQGTFEVLESGGKLTLSVKSDFRVSDGPDLYFAFHPLEAAKITGSNAKTNAFRAAKLKSLTGAQAFDLPADFDLTKYSSLVIHCWQYNHLYAAGTVTRAATSVAPGARPGKASPRLGMRRGMLWLGNGKGASFDALGKKEPRASRP